MTVAKLSNAQLAKLLPLLPMFEGFIKAIKLESMQTLARDPSSLPGYKIVEGQSKRRWRDQDATIAFLERMNYEPDDFAPRKLVGIGELAALLKKVPAAKKEKFFVLHTVKPHGKPSLVPVSDPRPPINGDAAQDFAEEIEE